MFLGGSFGVEDCGERLRENTEARWAGFHGRHDCLTCFPISAHMPCWEGDLA